MLCDKAGNSVGGRGSSSDVRKSSLQSLRSRWSLRANRLPFSKSVISVTDKTIVARYHYDPYGNPEVEYADAIDKGKKGENNEELEENQEAQASAANEKIQIDHLYTGHDYHANSGYYLAKYRVYDPQTGRCVCPIQSVLLQKRAVF